MGGEVGDHEKSPSSSLSKLIKTLYIIDKSLTIMHAKSLLPVSRNRLLQIMLA